MQVNQTLRTQWGNYSDRRNSYDDNEDIRQFIKLVSTNEHLSSYLKQYVNTGDYKFVPKPDGEYGVDLSLQDKSNNIVLTIDIERWSQWNQDWPEYYKHIHFLGRKEKFLKRETPFFMGFMNYHRTKVLMISKKDIQKYPTIEKFFKHKQVSDKVRELSMKDGYVFGDGLTEREKNVFNAYAEEKW